MPYRAFPGKAVRFLEEMVRDKRRRMEQDGLVNQRDQADKKA